VPVSALAAPGAIVVGTAVSYLIGWAIHIPLLVPFLNVLPAYPLMAASLRSGNADQAIVRMWIWAAALGICATSMALMAPEQAGRLFIHADAYRREMFEFVLTGRGAEGDIRVFLPQHVGHALVFCGLALATGSLLAMPLGAVLMNYMAYYVGALGAVSAQPLKAIALAWVPWALLRVASFVVLGVVLGGPVLSRILGFEYRLRDQRRWIALACCGLLLDIVLKWALAPHWRLLIRAAWLR
jgi:hypothetical protein